MSTLPPITDVGRRIQVSIARPSEAAKAAAPYCHPRLNSTELTGEEDRAIVLTVLRDPKRERNGELGQTMSLSACADKADIPDPFFNVR
jgi:hypothetical protein